jgi:hypothetical protein
METKGCGGRQQRLQRKERTFCRRSRETVRLHMENRIVGSSVGRSRGYRKRWSTGTRKCLSVPQKKMGKLAHWTSWHIPRETLGRGHRGRLKSGHRGKRATEERHNQTRRVRRSGEVPISRSGRIALWREKSDYVRC